MIGDRKGFTLMEMLVALGLFSVVVVIATDLFSTFQKISRKTESLQQLTSDSRFITETIARYVRENTIDYSGYASPIVGAQETLRLRTRDQDAILIAAAEDCFVGDGPPFSCVTLTRGGTTERISGSKVWIKTLRFYIAPDQNPFTFDADNGQYLANAQPQVTVFLSIANNLNPAAENYTKYDVQTTITNRIYTR